MSSSVVEIEVREKLINWFIALDRDKAIHDLCDRMSRSQSDVLGLVRSFVWKNVLFKLSENVSGWEVVTHNKNSTVATETLSNSQLPRTAPDHLSEVTRS